MQNSSFVFALKLNFNGGQFIKNIKFWLFQEVEKIRIRLEKIEHLNIVKFEVENFEHLHSNTRAN